MNRIRCRALVAMHSVEAHLVYDADRWHSQDAVAVGGETPLNRRQWKTGFGQVGEADAKMIGSGWAV